MDIRDVNADGQSDIIAAGTDGVICCYRQDDAFEGEQPMLESLEAANWTRPLSATVAIVDVESRAVVHAYHALDDFSEAATISPDGTRLTDRQQSQLA